MAFIDKVKEYTSTVAQNTSERLEISQVTDEIAKEEEKAREILARIGEKAYEKYKSGIEVDNFSVELCESAEAIMNTIYELKNDLLRLNNKKMCNKCNKELDKEDLYCKACGARQAENPDE